MQSVLQDWVMELPLREQGTLLTGVRGCDVVQKGFQPTFPDTPDAVARGLVAFLRFCFMVPADAREIDVPGAFFKSLPPARWRPSMLGHLPQHFYAHLMHAFEVVGMRHPNGMLAAEALSIYHGMVENLHLQPESFERFEARMTEDRIANGTVVS